MLDALGCSIHPGHGFTVQLFNVPPQHPYSAAHSGHAS
jgi:hypothetical protein